MTTARHQSRTNFPVRPLAMLGIVLIGIVIGGVAVRWDRDSSGSSESTASTALAPWVAPAPATGSEALEAEMAAHEALTEAQFGPILRFPVSYDDVSGALAEHDNAITASLGTEVASASLVSPGRTYDEALADALAQHDAAFPPLP